MLTSRSLAGRVVTSWPPMRIRPPSGCSSPASMRRVVVLPQPEGPSSVTSVPASIVEVDALDCDERAEGLADGFEADGPADGGRGHAMRSLPHRQRRRRRDAHARYAPQPSLADRKLEAGDDADHHDDQHARIGDRDTILAVLDETDDIGRRHVVLRR